MTVTLFFGLVLCALSVHAAERPTPAPLAAAPQLQHAAPVWQNSRMEQPFQIHGGQNVIVIDDRAVSDARPQPGQATSKPPQPTPAKRPSGMTMQAPQLAIPADSARPNTVFSGPPVRPAQPFVGWKFGRSQDDALRQNALANTRSKVVLVPQYAAYLADEPKVGRMKEPGAGSTAVASQGNSSVPGRGGTFFSLQNSKPKPQTQPPVCPDCGRRHRVQVANQPGTKRY
jgi:hypothetical protein